MTETTGTNAPPTDRNDALAWLLERHPDVKRLLQRFRQDPIDGAYELPDAFTEDDEAGRAWRQYQDRNPEPDDEEDHERWRAAGPVPSPRAATLGVLSSGELRALRLVAMLTGRVPIGVEDVYGVDFPNSRTNFVNDWLQLVATGAGRW